MHRCRLFYHNQRIYLYGYIQVTKHQNINSLFTRIETSPLVCSKNQWTGFYMIGTSIMKVLRHSSPIILRKSALTCCKVEFASFCFLSGVSFTNIPDSPGSRGRGRLSLYILSTTSTRFTDT